MRQICVGMQVQLSMNNDSPNEHLKLQTIENMNQ